ncbi:F0F1-type ATP synthase membrane subunit b/b' [Streptomyces sp. SAI-170]|uniref:hypothetical protein n=1 Tax=unclassified Streptomyces TaxID=2593676 RepID=UPI0037FD388C
MGMKDQFQDKTEQWQQQAKGKMDQAKEQAKQRGQKRGQRPDEEPERTRPQDEQDRLDPDYDM